jgi:hypothetical protein
MLVCASEVGIRSQARQGAISGLVVDAATNAPIQNAAVTLDALSVAVHLQMLTDAKGRFVFYPLDKADDYTISADRLGYLTGRYGWKLGASEAIRDRLRIAITAEEWRQNVSIQLWRLGSISGRVVDETGQPIVGVAVASLATVWIAGRRHLVPGPVATTDDRGVYRIEGLPAGDYSVLVLSVQSSVPASTPTTAPVRAVGELESGGARAGSGPAVSAPGILLGKDRLLITNFAVPPGFSQPEGVSYPATYCPGSVEQANRLSLQSGEHVNGHDCRLDLVPAFTVGGKLIGHDSHPLLLRLMAAGLEGLGFGFEVATTLTSPDGSFAFLQVPRGSYTLLAQPAVMGFSKGDWDARMPIAAGFVVGQATTGSYPGTPGLSFMNHSGNTSSYWTRMPVEVNRVISDLNVELRPTIKISGRVEITGRGTASSARPTIFAEPANGDPSLGNPSTRVNADGTFELQGLLAGHYVLRILSGPLVASVTWQGRNIADSGVDTTGGSNVEGVVLSMTTDAASLSGKVEGATADGPAVVISFPVQASLWRDFGFNPSRIRVAQTDAQGTYSFPRLVAGECFVVALDAGNATSWTDPDFLAAAAQVAARQALGWGEKGVKNLSISKVVTKK